MALQIQRRLFTVNEYHKMAEAGILGEDDRVELLEGEIVQMAPIDIPHPDTIGLLGDFFLARVPESKMEAAMIVQAQRRLFTVSEYYKMAEAGILCEDDRVELLEGEIVQMPPIGSSHGGTVDFLANSLYSHLGARAIVRTQNPVRLDDFSEPEPDIALLRPRPDFYRKSHPTPGDVYLLIEVAESSVSYDREVKLHSYARAGVPEVWLVDLTAQRVEVYSRPSAQGYEDARIVGRGSDVAPHAFPDVTLRVDDVLG